MSVSQSCLRSFLCNPNISFQIFIYLSSVISFLDRSTMYIYFAVYLVTYVLANALYISETELAVQIIACA